MSKNEFLNSSSKIVQEKSQIQREDNSDMYVYILTVCAWVRGS